jgi:hypothetical protein
MSTIQLDINDDGQLLIDEVDRQGRKLTFSAPYSRTNTLLLAAEIVGKRIVEGSIDSDKTLNAFCFELGAIAHVWDQGDRVLTERYVDNDTGET